NLIKETLNSCPDNNNTVLDFNNSLTNGSWEISYFYHDYEKTQLYIGYVFTFNNNNTVIATKSGSSLSGVWSTKLKDGVREFELDFSANAFDDLELNWKLFEFNNSRIRFRGGTSNSGTETDYLYFTKIN
ncbi:MAG: hypothetical protein RL619_885, partial [Bacteroidota bacterium]